MHREGITIRTAVTHIIVSILFVLIAFDAIAQSLDRIQEIAVESNVTGREGRNIEALVKDQCGLAVGSVLSRDSASEAINRLWYLRIFSDITVKKEDVQGGIKVIFDVKVLPSVDSINLEGNDELKEEEIINTIKIAKYMKIGNSRVAQMKNQILDMYREKGFLRAQVDFEITPIPDDPMRVDVKITINEGAKIKIKSIHIEGNENISDRALKKQLETKEHRWYRSGEYKEEVLEEDKNRIVAFYKTKGYRDAVVLRDSVLFREDDDKVNLMIFLDEGKQYKFGKTMIEGNTEFSSDDLFENLEYQEGEIFNEMLVDLAAFQMQSDYNNRGYLQAMVNPVQIAHGDTVDINFSIAESFVSHIKRVVIQGNSKTHEKVIRREIELLPGDAFNREKLERSYREIMALNYFDPEGVSFDYDPPDEDNNVNIRFKVKERSTGIAQVGAGYSERDNLVGTLAFQNSNLFGRGQSVNFSWEQGSTRKSLQVYFTEPWLLDTPTIFSVSLYNIIRSDYTTAFDQESRRGGYVRLGRELKWPDYSRAYVTYRLEDTNYENASEYYSYYLVTGKTSSLTFSLSRDSTDLPQFASKGSKSYASFELAGGPLGGDLSYYKYFLHNEVYFPVLGHVSLMTRSRLGYLKGYQDNTSVPYSERFMPGGTSYDGIVLAVIRTRRSVRLSAVRKSAARQCSSTMWNSRFLSSPTWFQASPFMISEMHGGLFQRRILSI